ncbi:MAG: urea ABC transporter permease subunit UrtB [Rhodospirillaceae bacterium TMED8]|nr:urea ABC transporter permease subunit UrtB [Magnetovibrio sp.]OUT53370.1 MAG: urea ABC transporter permease subunit UrtB [Rhodospirillaceae bacterium TMED8]
MRQLVFCLLSVVFLIITDLTPAAARNLQAVLMENLKSIERPSRRTVGDTIENLFNSGVDGVPRFLQKWRDKKVWLLKENKTLFYGSDKRGDIELIHIVTGKVLGSFSSRAAKQIKPNSGVRSVIDSALVRFQLSDPDPKVRGTALQTLERNADAKQLKPLRDSVASETDLSLKARKKRLERLLTISFGQSIPERVIAIKHFEGDVGIDLRAALNPLLSTTTIVAAELPKDKNIARQLQIGIDISKAEAHAKLASRGLAPQPLVKSARDAAIIANAADGKVEGVALGALNTEAAREKIYRTLVNAGKAAPFLNPRGLEDLLQKYIFFEIYTEPDPRITDAALNGLTSINAAVNLNQALDLGLDALSLASIYFLAAIGLAITFGVMRVINMAHGEFIMMGAYTGYLVQQLIPNYTISIVIALPLAFAVTFAAGVILERLVIRHLMHRPLETLLATFGISIALQQLAKNMFGTQAVPLTAPSWLDGSLIFNDIVSISYIRIAIFFLAAAFCLLLLYILRRTRLGLEVRAVTQNPLMASSMGINPDRINMLTFGLGSGIAGIAGVAIGLFAQVSSELGANYIVQSFMTVVVGGVGSIVGTLAGAGMIGSLQKVIEWFNPSNTLAAQTYMIIFVIIFIQFRPRGIIAIKGRAAEE